MKTYHPVPSSKTLVSQLENNSSQWLGSLPLSQISFKVGQTFVTPASAMVDSVQICADAIQSNGVVELSFHEFNESAHSWGAELGKSSLQVARKAGDSWLKFDLGNIRLEKNKTYGFILTSNDALIAISEVAWGHKDSKPIGEEWSIRSNEKEEHFFNYFSLVYRIGICA
jgi:hypothetical protein